MASSDEKVVFEIEIDNKNSIKSMKDLIDRQKELKKQILAATDTGSEAYEELRKEIKANQKTINDFNRDLRNSKSIAERVSEGVTKSFKQVGVAIAGAFAFSSIADFGRSIVDLTSTIEDGFARVNTVAQLSQEELNELKNQAIEIGKQGGSALEEIPDALFDIVSATGDTDLSLSILETAVKATDAGFGNLGTTSNALVNIMNAVGQESITSAEAANILFATQKEGVASFDELAKVIPNVIPAAKSVGFSFEEVSASLATLTKSGLDANSSATSLRALFSSFTNKGKLENLNKALGSVGSSVFDSEGKLRDLTAIVSDFDEVLSQATSDEERTKIFADLKLDQNSIKALQGLIGNVSSFNDISTSVNSASEGLGELQTQLELSENGTRSIGQANNAFKAELLELGQEVVPVLEAAQIRLYGILEQGVSILNSTIDFFKENETAALILKNTLLALGAVLSSKLLGVFTNFLTKTEILGKALSFLRSPITAIIGLFGKFGAILRANPIGLLVTGITAAYTAWQIFNQETETAGSSVKEFNANSDQLAGTVNNLNNQLAVEIKNSNDLFGALKNTNLSQEERKKVLGQINEQYKDYLPNLLSEESSLNDIERAQNAVNAALTRNFTLKIEEATQIDAVTEKVRFQREAFNQLQEATGNAFSPSNFVEFQETLEGLASTSRETANDFSLAFSDYGFNAVELGTDRLNKFIEQARSLSEKSTPIEDFFKSNTKVTKQYNESINASGEVISRLSEGSSQASENLDKTAKSIKKVSGASSKGTKEIVDKYKEALDQIKGIEEVQKKEAEATFLQRKRFLTELLDSSNLTEQARFNLVKSLSDQEKILKSSVRDATKTSLDEQLKLAKEFNKDSELLVSENRVQQEKNELDYVTFVIQERLKLDAEKNKITQKEIERSLTRLAAESETAEREIAIFKAKFVEREKILRDSGVSEEAITKEKNDGIALIAEKFGIASLDEAERIEKAKLQIEFNGGEQSLEQKEAFDQAILKSTLARKEAELQLLQDLGIEDEARILELKAGISSIATQIKDEFQEASLSFKEFSDKFGQLVGTATQFSAKLQEVLNLNTDLALQSLDRQADRAQLRVDEVQTEINEIDNRLSTANATQQALIKKERKEAQARLDEEKRAAEKIEEEKEKLREEAFERNKAFAIATAAINGALAVTKAIADLGPIAGPIAAAFTGVTTAFQIALIANQQFALGGLIGGDQDKNYVTAMYANGGSIPSRFPAKTGGMIKGPSHSKGGVPFSVNGRPGFEAQGNEFITSVPATKMFYPVLKVMNDIGNKYGNNTGRLTSFTRVPPKTNFATGGQIPIDGVVSRSEFKILLEALELRDSKLAENQAETNDILSKMKLQLSISEVQEKLIELSDRKNSDDD